MHASTGEDYVHLLYCFVKTLEVNNVNEMCCEFQTWIYPI